MANEVRDFGTLLIAMAAILSHLIANVRFPVALEVVYAIGLLVVIVSGLVIAVGWVRNRG